MANFSDSFENTSRFEGGYQNNPNDTGNYACGKLIGTNHGIAAVTLQDYLGRCPTVEEMKKLSVETAKLIYYNKFWLKIGGDYIGDQDVANIIFDTLVNQTGYLKYIIRDSLASMGVSHTPSIPFTKETIDIINQFYKYTAIKFYDHIKEERLKRYKEQANKMASDEFLEGWENRCFTGFGNYLNACVSEPPLATNYLEDSEKRLKRQSYGGSNTALIFASVSGLLLVGGVVYLIFKK